jgi:hypothetical protein
VPVISIPVNVAGALGATAGPAGQRGLLASLILFESIELILPAVALESEIPMNVVGLATVEVIKLFSILLGH